MAASRPVDPSEPTRRSLLAGAGAAILATTLAACGHHRHGGATSGRRPPASQPPLSTAAPAVLSAAISAEQTLIGAYAATLRRHPQLVALLAVPLDHHRAHAEALGGRALPAAPPAASATVPLAVPLDPSAALRALLARESAAARDRRTEAVADRQHGGLLASVAAAEAVHVDLLTAALARRP